MQLGYHRRFLRQYGKLSTAIAESVDDRLRLFSENEFHSLLNNHKLKEPWTGCRSINITGDYRAIYKSAPNFAYFMAVGTHSELYGT